MRTSCSTEQNGSCSFRAGISAGSFGRRACGQAPRSSKVRFAAPGDGRTTRYGSTRGGASRVGRATQSRPRPPPCRFRVSTAASRWSGPGEHHDGDRTRPRAAFDDAHEPRLRARARRCGGASSSQHAPPPPVGTDPDLGPQLADRLRVRDNRFPALRGRARPRVAGARSERRRRWHRRARVRFGTGRSPPPQPARAERGAPVGARPRRARRLARRGKRRGWRRLDAGDPAVARRHRSDRGAPAGDRTQSRCRRRRLRCRRRSLLLDRRHLDEGRHPGRVAIGLRSLANPRLRGRDGAPAARLPGRRGADGRRPRHPLHECRADRRRDDCPGRARSGRRTRRRSRARVCRRHGWRRPARAPRQAVRAPRGTGGGAPCRRAVLSGAHEQPETEKSAELRCLAQAVADALPPTAEEIVLTGSVSRGVADEVSDIEMLIVTHDEPELEECFSLAAAAGLTDLGSWGRQGVPAKRVSGYRDGVPLELIWWSRRHAGTAVHAIFAGDPSTTADALAKGVALRTSGLLAQWQDRLTHYPDELARTQIEDAALTWGGFAAAGLLTLLREGERLALLERMVD